MYNMYNVQFIKANIIQELDGLKITNLIEQWALVSGELSSKYSRGQLRTGNTNLNLKIFFVKESKTIWPV